MERNIRDISLLSKENFLPCFLEANQYAQAMPWSRESLLPQIQSEMRAKGIDSYAQLEAISGVKATTIKDFFSGKAHMLRGDSLCAIMSSLGILTPPPSLPCLGQVPSSSPVEITPIALANAKRMELPRAKAGWFLVRAWGDSMNLIAQDGFLLAVNPKFDTEMLDGRMVIALYNGESTFKYYRSSPIVMLEPRSTNPVYRSIVPANGDELVIQGVVELIIGDMREKELLTLTQGE